MWCTIYMTTSRIQARIDASLKEQGERVLEKIGLSTTELMKMTFRQLVMQQGLPFDAKIPNADTLESFKEANNPKKTTSYSNAKEAISDMWGED
jgi:DNA-damage-inducible protein J